MAGLNHNSKRQKLTQKYTIAKKARAHKRKLNKEAKSQQQVKKPKNKSIFKEPFIPKACPFKQEILSDVYAKKEMFQAQRKLEAEKKKERKRLAKLQNSENSEQETSKNIFAENNNSLENLVQNALDMQNKFESKMSSVNEISNLAERTSKKHYFNQVLKLIESSDIIIEVLDARDPNNCRSLSIERTIIGMQKKLIILLNKIDLVPQAAIKKWLTYFRREYPTLAFKAASSSAENYRNVTIDPLNAPKDLKSSSSHILGATSLLSLLKNYARSGATSKVSISVGILGYPNVGKSSVINSLKRTPSAVRVGGEAGVTKNLQHVQLDSKVTLIDSPGVLFDGSVDDPNLVLRNSVKLSNVKDPEGVVAALINRTSAMSLAKFFKVPPVQDPQTFIAYVAQARGRLSKGGKPDFTAAARLILNDWTSGKIRYYCLPPELSKDEHENICLVNNFGSQFDINDIYNQENEFLGNQMIGDSEFIPMNGLTLSDNLSSHHMNDIEMIDEEIGLDKTLHFDESSIEKKPTTFTKVIKSKEFIKKKNRRSLYRQQLENDIVGSAKEVFVKPEKKMQFSSIEDSVLTPYEISLGNMITDLNQLNTHNKFGTISTTYSDDESCDDECI